MSDLHLSDAQHAQMQQLKAIATARDLDDPAAALNFTRRLQREQHGWTETYARRVVEEYKRFLLLAAVSEQQVTPSEAVDQAWHLHLVYTRSYHEWCDALFGAYLHHGPTKGGSAEGARFEAQYNHTLALYEAAFGNTPPGDIWPPTRVRFDPRHRGAWVRTSDYWLLPRRGLNRIAAGSFVFLAASVTFIAVPDSSLLHFEDTYAQSDHRISRDDGDVDKSRLNAAEKVVVGICVGMLAFSALILLAAAATGNLKKKDRSEGGGCSSWFGCGGGSGCGSGCSSGCGGGGCGGGCGG